MHQDPLVMVRFTLKWFFDDEILFHSVEHIQMYFDFSSKVVLNVLLLVQFKVILTVNSRMMVGLRRDSVCICSSHRAYFLSVLNRPDVCSCACRDSLDKA